MTRTRKHHNNKGLRQIKDGKTREWMKRKQKQYGILTPLKIINPVGTTNTDGAVEEKVKAIYG